MTIDPRLHRIVAAQPYPLLFATISGAHLYGFPPPDSDFDLRGAHVLPLEKVDGLEVKDETIESAFAVEDDSSLACRAEAGVDLETGSGELRRDSLRRDEIGGGRRLKDETIECEMFVGPDGGSATGQQQRRQEKLVLNPEPSPGLRPPSPTPVGEGRGVGDVIEMDIVSHDVKKFFGLLLKKNGSESTS